MKLFIKVENGVAKNNPAFEDNLIAAFGSIPNNWEPFVRVARPVPNVYQILDSDEPTYFKVDGVWTDVWSLRDMSAEEKAAKQQAVKDEWANHRQAANWSTWTFNEETCTFVSPIARPDRIEGEIIAWCGTENNWKEAPAYPQDGKQYQFDFFAWVWTEIVGNQ